MGEQLDLDSLVYADVLGQKRAELLDAFDSGLREAPAGPAAAVSPVSSMGDWGWRSCRRRRGGGS
jgi:hypothetical protein